jgi:ABC-type multidrug transport system fused ATPase/permease subunit
LAVLAVALLTVLAATQILVVGEQSVMPSYVGLSRSLGMAMVLAMLVQQYTQIESGMVSAERIFSALKWDDHRQHPKQKKRKKEGEKEVNELPSLHCIIF